MFSVSNLHAYYGQSHILRGVEFTVGEGEIVSLLGRNGVGRSTTCKAIMGLVKHRGSIVFKGEEVGKEKPHIVARKGIGYVPEDRSIFPTLTVQQNLELGQKNMKKPGRWTLDDVYNNFPRLQERCNVLGVHLSGGEQQMLTICRSLMGDPDFIMIDEPTEGLAPQMVALMGELIANIAKSGISVLLVEQKLTIALAISHRMYVMGHGKVVFEGTPDSFEKDDTIRKEWLEV
ncbi:ABC transporter related [Desulfatibacillum aliphaticivorans]|uniref:ABC transporter related n=1 Tax=Desulfatibacillum aliphaticivorans TaxID=218208 RepID=B8FJ37_DESAL|nr:ABC transporter ATP-binding protein [Desulfatibacillum aliphaticivorans]ACL04964.1 ABC transporter related [Desulfatibacillum aliphaticivorans]